MMIARIEAVAEPLSPELSAECLPGYAAGRSLSRIVASKISRATHAVAFLFWGSYVTKRMPFMLPERPKGDAATA